MPPIIEVTDEQRDGILAQQATTIAACDADPACAAERAAAAAIAKMSALEQASVAFEGNPSLEELRRQLDEALQLYDTPVTEENYSRAGSVLVTLRREHGIAEMVILDHMVRSHVAGVEMTFPQAAAISAVALLAGDR